MIDTKPSWCYKPISIPNLTEIQNELEQILYKNIPDFDTYFGSTIKYIPVERAEVEPFCPKYTKFIESLGILDRWTFSLLSVISTNNIGHSESNIHVDTENWQYRCYGLNIPIINCEGTYTVWYEGTIKDSTSLTGNQRLRSARFLRSDLPHHEIARLESCNPAWVNVTIPHVPVNTHGRPRAAFSARFNPEVHDLFL